MMAHIAQYAWIKSWCWNIGDYKSNIHLLYWGERVFDLGLGLHLTKSSNRGDISFLPFFLYFTKWSLHKAFLLSKKQFEATFKIKLHFCSFENLMFSNNWKVFRSKVKIQTFKILLEKYQYLEIQAPVVPWKANFCRLRSWKCVTFLIW